jgi:hypothetical protein
VEEEENILMAIKTIGNWLATADKFDLLERIKSEIASIWIPWSGIVSVEATTW